MKDIVTSLKVFESREEIYAIALVIVMDYVPLKRVKAVWKKLYMKGLSPSLNPKKLSAVLREVGLDREGQNTVFNQLMKWEVYDLSVVFTNQRSISLKWDTTRTKQCERDPRNPDTGQGLLLHGCVPAGQSIFCYSC